MAEQTLTVRLIGDDRSLMQALGRSSGATKNWATSLQKSSKIAALALGGGLVAALKVGLDEVATAQKVAAQTAAVLSATGGAAKVTQKDVERLASSISSLSGVDDEAIQSGQNLLLTFKQVANEAGKGNAIYDRATRALVDLSVAGFGSINSTAKLVGKSLNDPISGLSALSRAGVTFTAKQKALIKSLVETGDRLGAQKIILKEIESQVGGSAKAYGTTLAGQLAKARVAFENLAGELAEALVPALTSMAQQGAKAAKFLSEHKGLAKALVIAVGALAVTLGTVSVATKTYAAGLAVMKTAQAAATAAQWLLNAALTANPVGAIVVGLAALTAGLVLAWRRSETFRRIVTGALEAVRVVADKMIGGFRAVLDFVRTHWKTIAVLISGPFAPIVALATDAFGIRSALVGAFRAVRESIGNAIRGAVGALKRAVSAVGNAAREIGKAITDGILAGIGDLGDVLWKKVKGGLAGTVGRAKDLLKIGSPSKVFEEIGLSIGQGLIAGIDASTRNVGAGLEESLKRLRRDTRKAASAVGVTERQALPMSSQSFLDRIRPAGSLALAGTNMTLPAPVTAPSASPVVVEVPVYLDGVVISQSVTRHQQVRRERTSAQRRGTRPGVVL